MNVHEALEYLENLDVSSEDDLSHYEDFMSTKRDTDEDSGDESECLPNNLNSS